MSVEDLSLVDETFFDQQVSVDRDQQIVVSLRDAFPEPAVILAANLQLTWTGPAADVSMIELASPDNDWHATLRITHDPDSCQTCVIRITVRGSVRALRQNIDSDPENCLLASDEFCTAAFTCQDDAPRLIGDSALAPPESFLLEPIYPLSELHQPPSALAPVCYRASARYECRIRSGQFCIDSPGGSSCSVHQDNEGAIDTCAPMLEAHPECTLSRSGCTESGIGHGDWCYVESHTYRCPESVVGPSVRIHTTQPCSGQIRCAGDDCLDQRFAEQSIDSLADGMAGMMIAQTYASDWQAPADPNRSAPAPPRLFPGKPYECRKALGGTIDCCDQTETSVESEWFAKFQRHLRRANATDSLARYASAGPHGSWKTLAESRNWSLDQLSKELTSGPETVSGGDNPVLDPDDGSIVGGSRLLQPMNDEFRDESRFDHMAEVGWACSVEEFDLANQRELGHCLSIGSYCHHQVLGACLDKRDVFCCFNSAASRTLRETIAGPDGAARGAFGTARNPQCEGVSVDETRMQSLDITDLKGRLARAGVVPSATDVLSRSSTERLTGSGSNLADGDRSTVQQRTQDRLGQILGADVRDALHAEGVAAIPSLTAHDHAGQLSFAPAYLQVAPGRVLIVSVLRQGTAGEVSVQVVPGDGGHWPAGMPAISETLSWADGQDGFQQLSLTIPRSAAGSFVLRLTNPSGGAVLYPNDQATVKLVP
ncbi:MAG: conjugal transfer protein TraN [Ahniella sp.]|nr:conjugal transfer protein TraN [Ahniella sp.]